LPVERGVNQACPVWRQHVLGIEAMNITCENSVKIVVEQYLDINVVPDSPVLPSFEGIQGISRTI
tara:strand:- start:1492 stop:1686 length:195 start_codon:yes stop_codon:yes gene_type:complete